jgi:RHS repeat-associated protein
VAWRARYRTWGNTALEEWDHQYARYENTVEDRSQNIRLQGQYLDSETELHYNTFRYYDPDIGRFASQDPIGLLGGLNLYQYAPDPLQWIDPWGLKCFRAERARRGVRRGYEISHREAIRRVRNGEDIWVTTRQEAKAIARAAQRGRPMMDTPHAGLGRLLHAHPNQHARGLGHIFYGGSTI